MTKDNLIHEKFKKLSEIDHVLLRPGRYLGSISKHAAASWVFDEDTKKMVKKEITYIPAFIKVFDEIISNSVDFSTTKDGKHLDVIKVEIDKVSGEISVYDNGGIPVVIHPEYDQYIPEMIFELRAGSNFDDSEDSVTTGQNGEGAGLTCVFSTSFKVETCDGKNKFVQIHTENSKTKTKPKISESSHNHTKITYTPDYEKFGLEKMDDGNYEKLTKRVYDVAGCNPHLKIYLNGKRIQINSFKDYIEMYTDEFVFDDTDNWKIGIAHAKDGFEHVSFVNGTETTTGGTHISYVRDQIVIKLREYFKKKHKVDIKPSDIYNHFWIFINATIVKPRYSSQTKEDLITEIKDYKTTWEVTDKMVNKIIKSPIIQSVLDWVEAKAKAIELAELRKLNKDTDKKNLKNIENFNDANEKDPTKRKECTLYLVEGISASKAGTSARDPRTMGFFALKGKPINVSAIDVKKLVESKEFQDILAITGLKIGVKVESVDQLRFGRISSMTDADCLHGETMIVTDKGDKKIKDINVGDSVLTHTQEYKEVIDVIKTKKKKIYTFTINGSKVVCSENHKFPVFRDGKVIISLAKDILKTDLFLVE